MISQFQVDSVLFIDAYLHELETLKTSICLEKSGVQYLYVDFVG